MKNSVVQKSVLGLIIMLLFSSYSQAQTTEKEKKASVMFEIDPATFALKGYGVHIRYKPKSTEHLLLGVGAYALDFPKAFVSFNSKNKNNGWEVRLNQGISAFGEYHFSEVNRKWFVGTQIGMQEYKIQQKGDGRSEKFTNLLVMTYAGYTWQLFQSNFYMKPWAGIGYSNKLSGVNAIGSKEYDIAPITMFATFHIGYQF